MEESILTSTKKLLGVGGDDTSFDQDILTHINSAFSDLQQLGIGPEDGFAIVDDETEWEAFGVEKLTILSPLKTFIYLKVRMIFDPPTMPHHITAIERQITEHAWRLNVLREETDWVDPDPEELREDPTVVDGGGA